MKRREFIKKSAVAGVAASLPSGLMASRDNIEEKARIALIGVGLRGCGHLRNLLLRSDIEVPAICDIDEARIDVAQGMIVKAGFKKADVYTGSDLAYRDLLNRKDIDGVIISTPWLWHTRMAVDAMKAGKYAGVEVAAATTLEECWDLVNTYEETGIPLMILENVCYRRDVMAVLNMVRQGMFGEILHGRCGYQHDLRQVKFNDGKTNQGPGVEFGDKALYEARWRAEFDLKRNADVYPTHGLGPLANMMNINRGNRFVSLSSFATKARGLQEYIVNHPAGGPNHPNAKLDWKLGDIITTTIATANEETIIVTHDCNSPRPYSLGFRVQGTKGLTEFDMHTQRIYIEGVSPHGHVWEDMTSYFEKYDHPLWKKYNDLATGAGHGGMDFFVLHAFVEIVKRKEQAPLDAYDAAAWSAVTPLSEMSIAGRGELQLFPDFTRGRWINRKPDFALTDDY